MKKKTKKQPDVTKLQGDFGEFKKFVGGLMSLTPEEVKEIESKSPKEQEQEREPDGEANDSETVENN